jgi:hypothetical protein
MFHALFHVPVCHILLLFLMLVTLGLPLYSEDPKYVFERMSRVNIILCMPAHVLNLTKYMGRFE